MADSNITKRALAGALKELMKEMPFEKISVANICEKCDMNRKSFYYHFKDKYDLVNWIFDTEFISLVKDQPKDEWEFIEIMCGYFFENRDFYRKALQIKGQNSFPEYFREFLHPLLHIHVEKVMGNKDIHHFWVDFLADVIVCGLERWLLDKDCIPPDELISILKIMVQSTSIKVCQDMEANGSN